MVGDHMGILRVVIFFFFIVGSRWQPYGKETTLRKGDNPTEIWKRWYNIIFFSHTPTLHQYQYQAPVPVTVPGSSTSTSTRLQYQYHTLSHTNTHKHTLSHTNTHYHTQTHTNTHKHTHYHNTKTHQKISKTNFDDNPTETLKTRKKKKKSSKLLEQIREQ